MALARTPYSVNLDISEPNCHFAHHFFQGSNDSNFVVTLLKDGVEQTLSDQAKATVTIMYGMSSASGGCSRNSSSSKGSYVLKPDDTEYSAKVMLNEGKITLQIDENYTRSSGPNSLFLKVEDTVTVNTYSLVYTVDVNSSYQPTSVPDNLPTFKTLEKEVEDNKKSIDTNRQNISKNVNTISQNTNSISKNTTDISDNTKNISALDSTVQSNTMLITQNGASIKNINDMELPKKVATDLSNLPGFPDIPQGDILYKKDGKIESLGLNVDDNNKLITSPYSFKFPPNSFELGENIKVHDNGGSIEYSTKTLGKEYLLLNYENDPITGTKKPIYYERLQINDGTGKPIEVYSDKSTTLDNVTGINYGSPTEDHQTQAIYLDFVKPVTNLKLKLNINGKEVYYMPSKNAWDDTTNKKFKGMNYSAGIQRIPLKPFFTSLTSYNIFIYLEADQKIELYGSSTHPYVAIDRNVIKKHDIALSDEKLVITPEKIRDDLQSLSGTDRLDAAAIKNIPSTETGTTIKNKLEGLASGNRLSYNYLDDTPPSGIEPTKSTDLTDMPSALVANKILKVNSAGTAYNLVDEPTPGSGNVDLRFQKSFGIEVENKTGNPIPAMSFVFLEPTSSNTFGIKPITSQTGYNGELIGLTKTGIQGAVGNISIIDTVNTSITDALEGQAAYIGITGNTIQIKSDETDFDELYGRCGVFGEKNQVGENIAIFNGLEAQVNRLIALDNITKIDYVETAIPVVIKSDALYTVYKANISGAGETLIQPLPFISKVKKGTQIFFDNISGNYTNKIRLQAQTGDSIEGDTSFDIPGNDSRAILISGTNEWTVFYFSDSLDQGGIRLEDEAGLKFSGAQNLLFSNSTITQIGMAAENKFKVDIDPDISVIGDDGTNIDVSNIKFGGNFQVSQDNPGTALVQSVAPPPILNFKNEAGNSFTPNAVKTFGAQLFNVDANTMGFDVNPFKTTHQILTWFGSDFVMFERENNRVLTPTTGLDDIQPIAYRYNIDLLQDGTFILKDSGEYKIEIVIDSVDRQFEKDKGTHTNNASLLVQMKEDGGDWKEINATGDNSPSLKIYGDDTFEGRRKLLTNCIFTKGNGQIRVIVNSDLNDDENFTCLGGRGMSSILIHKKMLNYQDDDLLFVHDLYRQYSSHRDKHKLTVMTYEKPEGTEAIGEVRYKYQGTELDYIEHQVIENYKIDTSNNIYPVTAIKFLKEDPTVLNTEENTPQAESSFSFPGKENMEFRVHADGTLTHEVSGEVKCFMSMFRLRKDDPEDNDEEYKYLPLIQSSIYATLKNDANVFDHFSHEFSFTTEFFKKYQYVISASDYSKTIKYVSTPQVDDEFLPPCASLRLTFIQE